MDIRRRLGLCVLFGIMSFMANAQINGFEEAYKAFRQQAIQDYENFRAE